MLSSHRGDDVFRKNVWNAAKNIQRKKQIQQLKKIFCNKIIEKIKILLRLLP